MLSNLAQRHIRLVQSLAGYAIYAFREVARARAALFSVFLVIPSNILKSLSSCRVVRRVCSCVFARMWACVLMQVGTHIMQ